MTVSVALRRDIAGDATGSYCPQANGLGQAARLVSRLLSGDVRCRFARSFIRTAVQEYWRGIVCVSMNRPDWLLPDEPEPTAGESAFPDGWVETAAQLGRAAIDLPKSAAAYLLSTTYAAMLPERTRAELGMYFTPPSIAARLLDHAEAAGLSWGTARALDPSCGGSAFLAPVAERMRDALRQRPASSIIERLSSRLVGIEIDPFAGWLAQVFAEIAIIETCVAANRRLAPIIQIADALDVQTRAGTFDLVIGNPPYGRITLSPEQRKRFERSLYGHANLYGVFTDLAVHLTRPAGLIAFVTPTSFLAGQYHKGLRELLSREAPPLALDLVDERKGVFDGVLQETLLAVYRKAGDPRPASVSIIHADRIEPVGECGLPDVPGQPWLVPRRPADTSLVSRLRDMPERLSDWGYRVSTGPLVWNRHKGQMRDERELGCVPLIWAEAIALDGSFRFRAIGRNHKPWFAPDPSVDEWLLVDKPCVLMQRTTAKEQKRRLIAAVLPEDFIKKHGAATVENHVNMIRSVGERPQVSPHVVAAFLNSRAVDRVFRCLSGSVAVSAYELESMPLPPVGALTELAFLVASAASREAIDAECLSLYGLLD